MTAVTNQTQDNLFGEVIYAYTRKQAIEDGYQMKLEGKDAQTAREVGYKYPVYLTTGIVDLMQKAIDNPRWANDWDGILWDILWMSRANARPVNQQTNIFVVIITGIGRKRNHQMIIQVGPTDIDDPAPALTIMLPEEQ